MSTLNCIWRIIGTGLCATSFGLGGLVLSFIVIPAISLLSYDDRKKIILTRWLIHKSFRGFVRMISLLGVIDFDTTGAEQALASYHGKVVIANHPTIIDVVVLISIIPLADCIIKKKLWDNIYIKAVLNAAGYIKNNDNVDNIIKACQKSLYEGYSLIIFPEGTRTTPGEEMILQRGAANIALRCMVDLVPVLIRCEPSTLTKHEKWYSVPPKKAKITLRVQESFKIASFETEELSLSIKARHLTAQIKNRYTESLKGNG